MKRAAIPRTPMKRRLPKVSAEERAIRQDWLRYRPECEVTRIACFGPLTVHEPWTRARGGPTDDPRNFATACVEGNRWLSQSAGGMIWGYANGMLVRASAGPAWLEAGGRIPGLSRDEAIALIMREVAKR